MMRVRKLPVRYRDRSTDNILKILDWFQKKGVRAWAFRDLFESAPTIYYKYKKRFVSDHCFKICGILFSV